MLPGILTQLSAAPRTTETTYAEGNVRWISANVDVGSVDAGLETLCSDPVAARCTVEDLAGVEVIHLLLGENPGDLLGAQFVEQGGD